MVIPIYYVLPYLVIHVCIYSLHDHTLNMTSGADPGLTVGGATPTFDVFSAHVRRVNIQNRNSAK